MTQIITFYMDPKLTYVTMGCTISIFDISITYFTEKRYIANRRFSYASSYCCKCKLLGCAMGIYVLSCGLGSYRHKKLIKYI